MSEKSYPNTRDCEHGYLRRSCPHCEANEDAKLIEQQQQQIQQLTAENEALRARVGVLNDALNYATALAETGQVPRKEVHQKWRAMYDESEQQNLARIKAEAVREWCNTLENDAKQMTLGIEHRQHGASIYNWQMEYVRRGREYADQLEKNG